MTASTDDRKLSRYLLGRLAEAQRDELEVRLLADDETYAAMLAVEDDLIDAYARGELSDGDRSAFESHFLPRSGVAERIAFARNLHTVTTRSESRDAEDESRSERRASGWLDSLATWLDDLLAPVPSLRLVPIAAALLLALATGWLAWQNASLSGNVERLQAAVHETRDAQSRLDQRRADLEAELAAVRAAAADTVDAEELARAEQRIGELEGEVESLRRVPDRKRRVAASFLLTLATRSAGVPELVVPDAADVVKLQLDTAGDDQYYDAFRVRVLAPGGAEAWSRTGLAASDATGTVDVEVSAEVFTPGHYEVLLDGLGDDGAELVGAYEFQVRRP
jgi:hypothetical protein